MCTKVNSQLKKKKISHATVAIIEFLFKSSPGRVDDRMRKCHCSVDDNLNFFFFFYPKKKKI